MIYDLAIPTNRIQHEQATGGDLAATAATNGTQTPQRQQQTPSLSPQPDVAAAAASQCTAPAIAGMAIVVVASHRTLNNSQPMDIALGMQAQNVATDARQ